MPSGENGTLVGRFRRLYESGTLNGLDEGQLLDRFLSRGDDLAFEALVARHGPMVLGVCRRVLADRHDAEDAFQATFLVLARKAGSIRRRGLLGPWLHRVARRVATQAGVESARRHARERPDSDALADRPAPDETALRELRRILDEELDRLPAKYRAVVVLCHLEGLTHDEAARRLGWPIGSVKGRLSRARDLLRVRLSRRGVTLPAAALAASLAAGATAKVPSTLIDGTIRAATSAAAGKLATAGAVSASVAILTEGALRMLAFGTLKSFATGLVAVGLVAVGVGTLALGDAGSEDVGKPAESAPEVRPVTPATAPDVPPAPPPTPIDLLRRELVGTWTIHRIQRGGRDVEGQVGLTITITEDQFLDSGLLGEEGMTLKYRLDPYSRPKSIDLTVKVGGIEFQTLRGIYELSGDERRGVHLQIRLHDGGERPSEFVSRQGTSDRFISLWREGSSRDHPERQSSARPQPDQPPAISTPTAPPASPTPAAPESKARPEDWDKLPGTWEIIASQDDGRIVTPPDNHRKLRIDGDTITEVDEDGGILRVTNRQIGYTLGPDHAEHIKLSPRYGPDQGRTLPGIFALADEDSTLWICVGREGDQPESFVCPPGSKRGLLILRRVAPSSELRPVPPSSGLPPRVGDPNVLVSGPGAQTIEASGMTIDLAGRPEGPDTARTRDENAGRLADVRTEAEMLQLDLDALKDDFQKGRDALRQTTQALDRARRSSRAGPDDATIQDLNDHLMRQAEQNEVVRSQIEDKTRQLNLIRVEESAIERRDAAPSRPGPPRRETPPAPDASGSPGVERRLETLEEKVQRILELLESPERSPG